MSIIVDLKNAVMERSRAKKLAQFYALLKRGETVLDVGVSAETKRGLPARNYFLKHYDNDPGTYTGLGVCDLSSMEELFPGKRFVHYSGGRFPFTDHEFDWVFSNAVIEHVGDEDAQLLFVNEMLRVAKNVFFTTPNKFFPMESHTNIFFLHWVDGLFYKWCTRTRPWVTKNSLYLLSLRRLRNLMKASQAMTFSIQNNRLLGMSMTFTIICRGKKRI